MPTSYPKQRTFRSGGRAYRYVSVDPSVIPSDVRFDIPKRFSGATVLFAFGGFSKNEHDIGNLYLRVIDQSDDSVTYYCLADSRSTGGV